jgi:hypothetical protein
VLSLRVTRKRSARPTMPSALSMSMGVRERDNGSVRANCISGRTWQPASAAQISEVASHAVHRRRGRWTVGLVVA